MQSLIIPAYAKINLTFSILGTFPNGYHQVETIMQRISLADTVTITPAEAVSVSCPVDIPMEKNLAYKAYALFSSLYEKTPPVAIHIEKAIPEGAGMGGGSSDAAAVLVGLNQLVGNPFPLSFLEEKAAMLGADVSFLIASSTALCTGIGEKLDSIRPALRNCAFLIVKPPAKKSTANIYGLYDALTEKPPLPDTKACIAAVQNGNISHIGKALGNVFEPMMMRLFPEIENIKNTLLSAGSEGAVMTGSGTAVYGLFPTEDAALSAARFFQNTNHSVFVATPV